MIKGSNNKKKYRHTNYSIRITLNYKKSQLIIGLQPAWLQVIPFSWLFCMALKAVK